ncbi:MAG: flavodoxin family protein [Eubacteriales bacterium]|nr:flavodoxin family protein [Eubacteriales bacterium]
MKTLILFGSPRKKGNTAALLKPFMDELQKGGAEIIYYDVYEKRIEGCRACLGCQKDPSRMYCVVQDDMQPLLAAMAAADLIVYAAPVYIWSAPAPVKAVIDRSVYASCKYYGDAPHGPALLRGKRLALLTTCGYPVEKGADLFAEMMRRYCRHCGLSWVGMLAERQRNLKEPFMDAEKEAHARDFAASLLP